MANTVPLSVRIPPEDAEYIAQLRIGGAVTPSDKVRAIIRDSRQRHQQRGDYEAQLRAARDALAGVNLQVKSWEREAEQHSDLLETFIAWVAEAYAYVSANDAADAPPNCSELEKGVAERVFRLLESTARMAVTATAPCYDEQLIRRRYTPLVELTELINQQIQQQAKEK